MIKPIVKWPGGKTRLLPHLLARLPVLGSRARYFEPFAGGAALFFALGPARAVLGDANADLIACYRSVAEDVDGVIALLEHLTVDHSKENYYRLRAEWNGRLFDADPTARAAVLLYLNRACFNGLWRVNQSGALNSPFGDGRPVRIDLDNLRGAAAVLRRADLLSGDFRETVADARRGDVVYFDPPYVPASDTANFTGYTAGGFGTEEQCWLARLARQLTERGVHVLVSNSDTALTREIYAGFRIDRVRCDRRIAASAGRRGKVDEIVAVGFPRAVGGAQLELSHAAATATPSPQEGSQ